MANHMEAERVSDFLVHILAPLQRILDDDTIHEPQMGMSFLYQMLKSHGLKTS